MHRGKSSRVTIAMALTRFGRRSAAINETALPLCRPHGLVERSLSTCLTYLSIVVTEYQCAHAAAHRYEELRRTRSNASNIADVRNSTPRRIFEGYYCRSN